MQNYHQFSANKQYIDGLMQTLNSCIAIALEIHGYATECANVCTVIFLVGLDFSLGHVFS